MLRCSSTRPGRIRSQVRTTARWVLWKDHNNLDTYDYHDHILAVYIYTYKYIYISIYIYKYIYICICIYIYVYIYICICIYIFILCVYKYTAGKAGGPRSQTHSIWTIHSQFNGHGIHGPLFCAPRPRLRSACRHPLTILQNQTASSPEGCCRATKITINGNML